MNAEAIRKVADCLSPIRFNVRGSTVKLAEDFDPDLSPDTDYQVFIRYGVFKHRVASSADEADHVVRWYGKAQVRLLEEDEDSFESGGDEDEDFVEDSDEAEDENNYKVDIEVEFVETYRLGSGKEIPEQSDLVEFGKHNVQYHVWPYLRELFQSYGEKLGVGPIPLPHYTINV